MNIIELGKLGENKASQYLMDNGYSILDRNFKHYRNEIDIVALKDNELVIVEVKTRETNALGEPWRTVTKSKQKTIVQVAHQYVIRKNIDLNTRFDIISIVHNKYGTSIEHIIDAFTA